MSVLIMLVRKRRNHLVPAVAVEVGEFDICGPASPGKCRRRRLLAGEGSLAISQENQGLASRGERDQVLMSIAVEVAGREHDRALASFRREKCVPFPSSARARKEYVDAASPGGQLEAGIGDRQISASVAIEVRGCDRPYLGHWTQLLDRYGLPAAVGPPQVNDVLAIHDAGAGCEAAMAAAIEVADRD
jgi:hypothetical protein